MKYSDIVLVGGGVVALLSAYYLQRSGATITIIDKREVGKESSWAGGGILSPLYPWRYADPINQLSRYSQQHYQALSETLHSETGIDPEWIESGLLMIDCEDDQQTINQWAESYFSKNAKKDAKKLQIIDQQRMHHYEPQINTNFGTALYQNDVAQIRNPWLVRALKACLIKRGVHFAENTPVEQINTINNKVTGVKTPYGNVLAEKVIIASGAWSGLFKELSSIDVRPVMGQMILFKTEAGFLSRIVMQGGRYVIPRSDGHILCGSTLEWTDYEKTTTQQARKDLHQAAFTMIPALKKVDIIKQWCGLRPGSPNGVPYIGEHPTIKGLYVNTGHYRYGVVMGLASAQLLTDIINRVPSFVNKSHYALSAYRKASEEYSAG